MVALGLSSDEFWDLTPRQIHLLSKTYQKHEKRWDIRLASLWWRYANAHRGKDQRVIPFDEMFPDLAEPLQMRGFKNTFEQDVYNLEMWAAVQKPGTVRITRTPIQQNKTGT